MKISTIHTSITVLLNCMLCYVVLSAKDKKNYMLFKLFTIILLYYCVGLPTISSVNEKSADANTARAGCSKVRTPPSRRLQTHPQTGPITIHCAAAS